MKKYLVAGLLVWVPIVVTIIVIRFVLELMDGMLLVLPIDWRPEHLVGFKIPGIGLILALLVLFITGVLAANFLGKKLLYISEHFFSRIPLVRTIYKVVKQSMNVILSPKSNSFRQVVLLQYPRKGIWSLGFVTNKGSSIVSKSQESSFEKDMLTVFLPTTPNPTSGFLLFVPSEDVTMLDIPVDEALKAVISLGTVTPSYVVDMHAETNTVVVAEQDKDKH